ncbi:MAG: O-antigen ligase family protein [Candidatus Hodarchaeota archaeon]
MKPTVFVHRLKGAIFDGSASQWLIFITLGILLGVFAMSVSSLPTGWAFMLILGTLSVFAAMIVRNVRRMLLAVIILDIPFQLDTHFYYQDAAAALGALGGLSISVTTISLIALYFLWLSELQARVPSMPRHMLRMSLPLAAYLAFVSLSVIEARNITLSLFEIALLLQMFLLYVYIVGTVRTRQDILFIVSVLLISVVFEALVMIGLRFTGESFEFAGIFARIDRGTRVGGTVGSAINAAGYFCLILAPAFSILLTQAGRSHKGLAVLAFGLGVIGLVLTLSRGGWIAFFLSITGLCLLAWHRGWLSRSALITTAAVAVLLSLAFEVAIVTRLLGYDAGSAFSRVPLMKLAIRITMDNPVLGVGSNNFAVVMTDYAKFKSSGTWLYTVHNKYLLIAAEAGIGGLVTFIWFLFATLRRGWHCWKFEDRLLSPLALGFTVAIMGHMIHMLVDVFNSRPDVQLLWLVAGLITAMYSIAREETLNAGGGNS